MKKIMLLIPPPLIYLAAFAIGLGMERWFPLVERKEFHAIGVRGVGLVLVVVGFVLGPTNAFRFLRKGTTLNPNRQADVFVNDGWYRFTRNPMYLGLVLIYLGAAFLVGELWPLVMVIIPILFLSRVVIPHEEKLMTERFGNAYLEYCAKVSRWLGGF